MSIRERLRDGMHLLKRGIEKTVIGPIRYRSRSGYDARRYWADRFARHGTSLRGAGHEGLGEDENAQAYAKAAAIVLQEIERVGIDLSRSSVLEIGCGSGFYTALMKDHGVRDYTGIDITDELFDVHRRRFPRYRFVRQDVTSQPIERAFDLILMIDVAEHIVDNSAFASAMRNARSALREGASFVVGPFLDEGKKHLFYIRFWSVQEARENLQGLTERACVPFRDGYLLTFTA